ncbi:hypothetical protein BJ742DRAFT_808849 [Cladochytrium replicatum]|nr:hypothetical protein BJ742DRAFT_808849 [Cladochytrium replicatum]
MATHAAYGNDVEMTQVIVSQYAARRPSPTACLGGFMQYAQIRNFVVLPLNQPQPPEKSSKSIIREGTVRIRNMLVNIYGQDHHETVDVGTHLARTTSFTANYEDPTVKEEQLNQNDPDHVYSSVFHACDKRHGKSPKQFLDLIRHPTQLHKRGAHGETILHKLILRSMIDRDSYSIYMKMIEYLLDDERHRRALINSYYEGPLYRGECAAHMAAAAGDLHLLKLLVSKGADVMVPRCRGEFFSINSVQYMGETVLGMAIRNGQSEVAKYLLRDCRVEPNAIDHHGNTVLHMMAWWGITTWTQHAKLQDEIDNEEDDEEGDKEEQLQKTGPWQLLKNFGASHTLQNNSSYTPFLTAVFKKNKQMVEALLNEYREVLWAFGEVTAYKYPLTDIDINPNSGAFEEPKKAPVIPREGTLTRRETVRKPAKAVPKFKREYPTAVEIAVKNEDGSLLMETPLFRMVLQAKWRLYARDMFRWYFGIAIAYQLLLLLTLWVIPNGPIEDPARFSELAQARWMYFSVDTTVVVDPSIAVTIRKYGVIRFLMELILLVANVFSLFSELYFELWQQGFQKYFVKGFNSSHNTLQLFNILLFLFAFFARIGHNPLAENFFLSILSISGWMSLLYFGKGLRAIGPTVIMVYKMLYTDVLQKFAVIYSAFLIAFAQAIWLQMSLLADTTGAANASASSGGASLVASLFRRQSPDETNGSATNGTATPAPSADSIDPNVLAYGDPLQAILRIFGLIVNGGEFGTLAKAPFGWFAVLMFVIYMVLSSILLLNVLIAMLNSTYTKITDQAEEIWFVQWANLILEMDQKLSTKRLKSYRLGFPTMSDSVRYFHLEMKAGSRNPVRLVTSDRPESNIGDDILRDMRSEMHIAQVQPKHEINGAVRRGGDATRSGFWRMLRGGKLKVA